MSEGKEFDLEAAMRPIWSGNTVYQESVMFFPEAETGECAPAPLLYRPERILSVTSADLEHEYAEGRDFTVEEGCIRLTPASKIPVWEYDDFYLKVPGAIPISSARAPGRYVCVNGEDGVYAARQIAVTYQKKEDDRWGGVIPACLGGRLPGVMNKLRNRKPVTIVYYGDSIMTGCDASGKYGRKPNMPVFTDLVTMALKGYYGFEAITAVNTAVGGKDTAWGLKELKERVVEYRPDLVVVGFGMNDSGAGRSVEEYEHINRLYVDETRESCPGAEFLFLSTTLPNEDCIGWSKWQPFYQEGLERIVGDTPGTALVPMTDIHKYLLSIKRYGDMTGNGVNHPNDFLARIYAQAVTAALTGDEGK